MDAVGITADERAQIARIGIIVGSAVIAQRDIADDAVLIRNPDGDDDAAEIGDADRRSGSVGHGVQIGLAAAGKLSKGSGADAHDGSSPFS